MQEENTKVVTIRCSRCGVMHSRKGQRYCRACHAAYMRTHRPSYGELTAIQRLKSKARSYARVYLNRGKITPEPCENCGYEPAEMHHDDYLRPLAVRWLCRSCHLNHHKDTP